MTKTTHSKKPASKLNDAALVLSKKRRFKKPASELSHLAANGTPATAAADAAESIDISEMLTKRYGGISVYAAIMVLLAIAIVWTAVLTAEQVQQYHQNYMLLQTMKAKHRDLEIEHQRLIIEQQTFSATPQIASRAITELGMYSPSTKDKLILQPAAPSAATAATASNNPPLTPAKLGAGHE